MIIINQKKSTGNEVEEKPPSLESCLLKKKISLSDITSIEVQLKDIKQMKHSKKYYLQTLYLLTDLTGQEEDYIVLSKYKKGTIPFIKELLHTSWLIDKNEIEQKSVFELEKECIKLMQLIKKKKNINEIRLLEYKLYCLKEYLLQRKLGESIETYSLKKEKNL